MEKWNFIVIAFFYHFLVTFQWRLPKSVDCNGNGHQGLILWPASQKALQLPMVGKNNSKPWLLSKIEFMLTKMYLFLFDARRMFLTIKYCYISTWLCSCTFWKNMSDIDICHKYISISPSVSFTNISITTNPQPTLGFHSASDRGGHFVTSSFKNIALFGQNYSPILDLRPTLSLC